MIGSLLLWTLLVYVTGVLIARVIVPRAFPGMLGDVPAARRGVQADCLALAWPLVLVGTVITVGRLLLKMLVERIGAVFGSDS